MIRDENCTLCPLHQSASSVCLMNSPNPKHHRVMIVGEHPGSRDDELGKLFLGRLSTIFRELISSLKVPEKDIYLTNAIKCYPGEAEPSANDAKACKNAYLTKELAQVQPDFVITLGAAALKAFVGNSRITEVRGTPLQQQGFWLFPTFHPSMAIKRASAETTIRSDFKRFSSFIRDGVPGKPQLNYTVIRTFEDFNNCIDCFRESSFASFDLETTGLQSYNPQQNIQTLGLDFDSEKQFILPMNDRTSRWRNKPDVQAKFIKILIQISQQYNIKMNAHNGKFDNIWLMRRFGRDQRFFLNFDTMLASHVINENRRHGLKELIVNELAGPAYDVDLSTKTGGGKIEGPGGLYEYLAYDVYYTNRLYQKFKNQLQEDIALLRLFKHLVMPAARAMELVEYNGVWVNPVALHELRSNLYEQMMKLENNLLDLVGKQINWNSSQQVGKVLFEDLKIEPLVYTRSLRPATGESILLQLADAHPVVPLILQHREISKKISGFVDGWKERLFNDRMYPSYKIHGTITGRYSCNDPNLQQVPRDPQIRSMIDAPPQPEPTWEDPSDRWVFFQCDYSQIELRIAAMISKDPTMLRIFQTNGDIHTKTAMTTSGHDGSHLDGFEKKEWRKKAKAVNFGFLYGMGPKKFQIYSLEKYGVEISEAESKQVRKRFFETYSGLPKWHDRQRNIVHAVGQVRNPAGRIRHLPDIYSSEKEQVAEAERGAINAPVQGFGAEMMSMSIAEVVEKFSWKNLRIVGTVHDSMVGWVRLSMIHQHLPRIRAIMKSPECLETLKIDLPVPIEVDIEVGPWGKGQEYVDGQDLVLIL